MNNEVINSDTVLTYCLNKTALSIPHARLLYALLYNKRDMVDSEKWAQIQKGIKKQDWGYEPKITADEADRLSFLFLWKDIGTFEYSQLSNRFNLLKDKIINELTD